MFVPCILLSLLVLVLCIAASSSNASTDAALNLQDPTKTLQIPQTINGPTVPDPAAVLEKFLDSIDYSAADAFDMGTELRNKTLNADMKTTVAIVNEKLECFIEHGSKTFTPERIMEKLECFAKQGHDTFFISNLEKLSLLMMQRVYTAASVMFHGFFDESNIDVKSLVETAIEGSFVTILQFLQLCHIWSFPEQFHWFQALVYKRKGYEPRFWQTHSMDWNRNLTAIFRADNPILLNDLKSGIISENPLVINPSTLLDLVAKHDSLNIYQSLNLTLTTHLKVLAESGSFKILRHIAESQSIDLHLEDYPFPKALPEDFEFFWTLGYCYLPVSHFLSMACETGRDNVLKFLYQINPDILDIVLLRLDLATQNGHLNVLEWALKHDLPVHNKAIALKLVLNKHFKVFDQLQEVLNLSISEKQWILNEAVENNCLDGAKWLYDKFKIVPEPEDTRYINIKVLKWVESVNPRAINEELAIQANLNTLKWLSEDYPHLLTEDVKDAHNAELVNFEKMQWMILQGWKTNPDIWKSARAGETEMVKFGYNTLRKKPTRDHALVSASRGHVKILELIYSIDPSCIDVITFLCAVASGHLETVKYLESILELENTTLSPSLGFLFDSGNLEAIEWVYQHYILDRPNPTCIQQAIRFGHLHIIDWAIKKEFISTSDTIYLTRAAEYGQHLIFQRLADYGIDAIKPEDLMELAFKSGSLAILKHLIKENPKSVQILKGKETFVENHHVTQWLKDHNLWLAT